MNGVYFNLRAFLKGNATKIDKFVLGKFVSLLFS